MQVLFYKYPLKRLLIFFKNKTNKSWLLCYKLIKNNDRLYDEYDKLSDDFIIYNDKLK